MFEQRLQLPRPLVSVRLASAAEAARPAFDATSSAAAHDPAAEKEALKRDRETLERLLESISESVDDLEKRRQTSLTELQQAAVEIAIAVASRLVFQKILAEDFAVEELVAGIVGRLNTQSPVIVHLHPDDLAKLERHLAGRATPWPNPERLRLIADRTIAQGNCRAESDSHAVMSKIELQLSEIRQHLLENMEDAQVERRRALSADQGLRRFPDRRETA